MTMKLKLSACVGVLLVTVACGTNTPTGPTVLPPAVVGLSITGPDIVRTGLATHFTALARYPDGSSADITNGARWTVASAGIGSIDGNGSFQGTGAGATTISATYSGQAASKPLTVIQNYGGTWRGTHIVQSCDQSGFFALVQWCRNADPVGKTGAFTLILTQSGSDFSRVSGTFALGGIAGPIAGSVTADSRLNLGGTYVFAVPDFAIQVTVGGWDTQATGVDGMTGQWAQSLVNPGYAGNAYEQVRIVSATHVSITAAP